LITDKSAMKTVDHEIVSQLCQMISDLLAQGHTVTIVHGAGSFGHLKAKEWRIAKGADEEILTEQVLAVDSIRQDMRELNSILCESLNESNITTRSLPPSDWAQETGPQFIGDLSPIQQTPPEIVAVTFGDVVDCDPPKLFGILSGDDLMVRIGREIPTITHCIFLLGDTEGLLSGPPSDPNAELIQIWTPKQAIIGEHDSSQDVTGGIFLKLSSAAKIAEVVEHVWLLDGRCPERLQEILENGTTRGTRISL